MACHLFCTKPLSESMLKSCQTPRNIFQWNFIWNSKVFIQETAFGNLDCKMATILSWPQYDELKNKGNCKVGKNFFFQILPFFVYCNSDLVWVYSSFRTDNEIKRKKNRTWCNEQHCIPVLFLPSIFVYFTWIWFSISDEQFLLYRIAEAAIDVYGMVAVLSRASRACKENQPTCKHELDMATVFCNEVRRTTF